jgi:hypothetical protein
VYTCLTKNCGLGKVSTEHGDSTDTEHCYSCDIGFWSAGVDETLCKKTECPANLFPSKITAESMDDGCVATCPAGAVLYDEQGDGSVMSCPLCQKGLYSPAGTECLPLNCDPGY